MKKIFDHNHNPLYEKTFNEFISTLFLINKNNSKIIIGVSGGSSVNGFYQYINENSSKIPIKIWEKMIFVFADERLVNLNDPESNYKNLMESFFGGLIQKGLIMDSQIYKIDITKEDYLDEINNKIKSIDILLLGVGPDGHICSLFPDHPGTKDEYKGYIIIKKSPKPPSERITLSKNFVKNIKNIFIFFIGESKKNAFDNFFDISISENKCPAKIVLDSENLNIISDLGKI